MYDLIQATLTNLIEFTALAGFAGITVHAMWKHHTNWMATYCPPVQPYTPDTQVEVEALAPIEPALDPQPELIKPQQFIATEDIWKLPITSSPARYWVRQEEPVKPVLMLMPAHSEKPVTPRGRKPAQPKTTKPAAKTTRKRKVA